MADHPAAPAVSAVPAAETGGGRQFARVRDTVHGAPLYVVLGAFSETISGANRIERGRRIAGRAALQEASHCLAIGEVVYFAGAGGISLAAQIEAGIAGLTAGAAPVRVCIPLDTMVYLCRYADSLVSAEQMLVAERAEEALDAVREPILVFPAGILGGRFLSRGEERDSALLRLSGGLRNPYRFLGIGACLLRGGMPLPRHGVLLLIAVAAALALAVLASRLPSLEQALPAAQEAIAPILPKRLPANAADALQRFNLRATGLTAVAGRLGIRELSLSDGKFSAQLGEGVLLDDAALAGRFGFEQSSASNGRLSWGAALQLPQRELSPSAAPALSRRLVALRHLSGVRIVEQRRRTLPTLQLTELRLHVEGAVPFALEQVRALLEDLPATLRAARLRYDSTGLVQSAELHLRIRAAAS